MGLSEDLPDNFIRAVQFFTFLDLVCDGAEIEGFATPSANGTTVPSTLVAPTSANDEATLSSDEEEYIKLAQQDIFLNGRAIRNADNDETIINTSLAFRLGTEDQQIMAGIDALRRSETLTPAIVKNNGNPEANKITGTVQAGLNKNDTPRVVIVTLSWASLRQLHPFDGSSQGLMITEGPFANLNPPVGAVHIQFRVVNKLGTTIKVQTPHSLAAISVGTYA